MMWPSTRSIGLWAENTALKYLQRQGLTLLHRNYLCRGGEIDLIMLDHITVVFVEVRYRRTDAFGGAAASITSDKMRRIQRTAYHYLQAQFSNHTPAFRFDVVAIEGNEIEWIMQTSLCYNFMTHEGALP